MTDADRLRAAGLRGTPARLAILEAVRAGNHPGTDESDNHQHIVCRRCGTVADADCATGPPCLEPLTSAGFAIDRAEVTFWGLCPRCRALKDHSGRSVRP